MERTGTSCRDAACLPQEPTTLSLGFRVEGCDLLLQTLAAAQAVKQQALQLQPSLRVLPERAYPNQEGGKGLGFGAVEVYGFGLGV